MELKKAQKTVRIIAGIIFALTIFTLIFGIVSSFTSRGCKEIGTWTCFGLFFFILGIPILIGIISSIGLWNYKRWAQILIVVTFAIAFVVAFLTTCDSGGLSYIARFPLVGVLIVFSILFIYLFIFNKSIKQVFKKKKNGRQN